MKLNKISKAFFINLDRRKDRLDHINQNLPFTAERFAAIDAKQAKLTKEIKNLFPKTWSSKSKAEICCALSHYKVWKKLIADKDSDNYLILEDDVVFKDNFVDFWNQVFSKEIPSNYNLIYLGGCQPWNKPHYEKVLTKYNDYFYNIKKNDYFTKGDHFWHMNASSYILSKNAATLLCQWVEQHGIDHALDNFMQRFFNKNKLFAAPKSIYHLNPLMAYQLHEENDNTEIDKNSDLRYAEERFEQIPKKINLHYWPGMAGKKNFGDEMSSYIMKKLLPFNGFSYNVNPQECEINLIALGSYIQMAKDDYYIFGSGVRTERDRSDYKKLNVISVRGPKSRDFLISKGVDCPELYGDPGLFISRYYKPTIDPSLNGKIGIVPHITDKTNYNKNNSDKFYIIDPCQHWKKVIDQICSCESIVSSSLHGLICADSYNIPNVWMEYKLLDEGNFKFIDYFLSQGRKINKVSSLEDISSDIFYRGGNNINLDELSEALYSSSLNKKNKNISLINPTAISHDNKQYTLYRGEKYLKNLPPPLGFNRSELSYWIECDGVKKQCIFDFGDYSYKTMRRIDIEKHENVSMVEDLRFIQSSVKNTENGLTCLATCSLLPYIRIYQGTKNEDGTYNKNKPVGIEFFFRMAYCEVNLTKGIIKYKGMIDENSQVRNEKNWTSFIYNKKFFVIYSMFPLRYTTADSVDEISFRDQDVSGEILMNCSTNPINVEGNKFAMLCHKRNKDKDFHYDYNLVSFEVVDSKIVDINQYNVNIDSNLYCSSILMEGDKIKVFAGKEDIDNFSFYIDIPWLNKNSFPSLSLISHKQIPKKIHLSWKNKNILNSNYSLIKKGAKNLELLNPEWDIQVYDDEDINKLLRDTIGRSNWDLIKDRKITEKTDLWRLIKTYKEGGLYVDIDRYIDTPLSEIINEKTSMLLPTYQDVDFSQDFILTCPKNPIIGKAIANNLYYRSRGESLFFLAVQSYMNSVSEVLTGEKIDRGHNKKYFNKVREQINNCEYLKTYREIGPEHHTLFRDIKKDFNINTFDKDKADFYNGESVVHWNTDTQKKHIQFKNTKKQKVETIEVNNKYDISIDPHLKTKQQEFIQLKDQWQNFKDYNFFKYISKQLPKAESPKNKFNTYNPGQKIAIISLYTNEIADYAVYSEKSIKEYCEKQGYTFYIYREKLELNDSPNWSKAQALLNHIDDHDYIIWMDSDTLIFNPEKKFESIFEKYSKKFLFATEDIGGNSMLNSGVLIFKNHNYSKGLIKKWRDFDGDKSHLYASGGDQEILCDILKKSDGFGFNRKIFEMNKFNTDPRLVDNNTFILHFMAYPHQLKKIFMGYWNK